MHRYRKLRSRSRCVGSCRSIFGHHAGLTGEFVDSGLNFCSGQSRIQCDADAIDGDCFISRQVTRLSGAVVLARVAAVSRPLRRNQPMFRGRFEERDVGIGCDPDSPLEPSSSFFSPN